MKPWAVAGALALVIFPIVIQAAEKEPPDRHNRRRPDPYDAGQDWLQFNDPPQQTIGATRVVSAANVDRMSMQWRTQLPEPMDGSAAYISDVETQWGEMNLVIVLTMKGRLVAIDARSGAIVWQTEPPDGPRWTTSSPAVDPSRNYVYGYALDGYIHRYAIEDGREVTGDGWPQLVTLKGTVEKGSSALNIATAKDGRSFLYMTTAGYPDPGDEGDYQGHVVSIDLATGTQNVFNAACSDKAMHFIENGDETNDCHNVQSGIWARAGAIYDPVTDRVFVTTGNGVFDADQGGFNWGSSIVALRPDGSTDGGTPLDSYTPTDFQRITDLDLDLSSTGIAILPDAPGYPHLGVQSGKDWMIRLLDLEDLSGRGGPRFIGGELQLLQVPQGGEVHTRPATWLHPSTRKPWVFVANREGLSAFCVMMTHGQPRLSLRWTTLGSATSPIIANNVLYYAHRNEVVAVDPATGNRLWSDDENIGGIHWQSPIMVNGRLFIGDNDGYVTAYWISGR